MFKNYMTAAFRNISKNLTFSIINIGGLAIGLATVILIFLFVRDELSYDTFWPDSERLYRMEANIKVPGRLPETFGVTGGPYAEVLKKDFAEIEDVTRLYQDRLIVVQEDRELFETVNIVDSNFFSLFQMPFIEGNFKTALSDSNSMVLTQRMAQKYFGEEPALGQTLTLVFGETSKDYRISGVVPDLPENTHLSMDIVVKLDRNDFLNTDGTTFLENWGSTSVFTYIKFKEGADVVKIGAELDSMTDRNASQYLADYFKQKVSEIYDHYLIPINDIYLKGPQSGRMGAGGDMTTVQSFIGIAALILVISIINFINLSTARSSLRSKEISLRKVFGAKRVNIITQFLSETFVLISIALIGALILVKVFLPLFNDIVSALLEMNLLSDPFFLLGLAGLLVVVVLGAGFYPSFIVSGYRPADVLRQKKATSGFSGKLRSFFVILQFSISIGLIISTAVIYSQTKYATDRDLGYDPENILVLRGVHRNGVVNNTETLKTELLANPDILSVSLSNSVPFDINNNFGNLTLVDDVSEKRVTSNFRYIDENFYKTYGIDLLEGRNFDINFGTDRTMPQIADGTLENIKSAAIINEAAVRKFGFQTPGEAIGKVVKWNSPRELEIIGVIPDIHIMPATYEDEAMFYLWPSESPGNLSLNIKFKTDNLAALNQFVDKTWQNVTSGVPIEKLFLSERLEIVYQDIEARALMLGVFSILAVLVSSLGLYGLASFTAETRTQEVGIRKVLGASVFSIIKLMAWQFSKPVLLANLIAWPVAWYFMSDWLEGFVFRIELTPLYFVVAGALTLFIAWATVSVHAYRVARTNPVHALRYE